MKTGYKTGQKMGEFIGLAIGKIVKVVWVGIVDASKRNYQIGIMYGVLTALACYIYLAYHDLTLLYLMLGAAVVLGIREYILERPAENRQRYYEEIFETVGLIGIDESLPSFVSENQINDYSFEVTIDSIIPLSKWQEKKEILEACFNSKIIDIIPDDEDIRRIYLIIQLEPLPTLIDWNNEYIDYENDVLSIGIGAYGVVGMDLNKHAHAFIAGETGSGKSNVLKSMIDQSIKKGYDVVLIDFKRGVSFSSFSNLEIYYEYDSTIKILNEMVKETNRRLDLFRNSRVDNIQDYNRGSYEKLHRKIIFIDELAEVLKIRDKEKSNALYDSIETLTRLSRSVGINLIMGIQRPDSTVINGQIKSNVSFRVCGRFPDPEPSRIMLGSDLAGRLPNIKGRFIVKGDNVEEIQAFRYNEGYNPTYTPRIEKVYIEPLEPEEKSEEPKEKEEIVFDFSDIDIK